MRWNDPKLHDITVQFFITFSRTEYSLKAARFMPNKKAAEADWTAFASEIHADFSALQNEVVKRAVRFILENPPKKQINENGIISWSSNKPEHENETDLLLLLVRRIRNNLFHGGKFNGHWFEPERSGDLIEAGLIVLNACREVSPKVAEAYRG